jgi:hypothetical protein
MKRLIIFLVAALTVPTSVAIAKGPPASPGRSAPNVTYVLKGTLSAFTPYDSTTSTDGKITIHVVHSNYHGRMLRNSDLTFPVTAKTRITYRNGTSLATGTATAKGVLTVHAPRRIPAADLATTLQTYNARHVVALQQLTS